MARELNLFCLRGVSPGPPPSQGLSPGEARHEAGRCLGRNSCEACDLCRLMCPELAITREMDTGRIVIDLAYCKGCGICAAVCPKGAITMVLEED